MRAGDPMSSFTQLLSESELKNHVLKSLIVKILSRSHGRVGVSKAKMSLKMGLEERITTSFGRIARGRSSVCTQSLPAGLRVKK